MVIVRQDVGLIDREALRTLSKRSQSLITTRCTPVACDVETRRPLYREDDVDMLVSLPRRKRSASPDSGISVSA